MEKMLLRNVQSPDSAHIDSYRRAGGYRALPEALRREPEAILAEVTTSGLRGRGGAAFPTGLKWTYSLTDPSPPRYLICNADEGEPGTFKDRVILERNPHLLLEGMAIAAHVLGTGQGYVYLRGEYPAAHETLTGAIRQAVEHGYLGDRILGHDLTFHVDVFQGAGAYICGEETALIESLEGKRGQPRSKPPFPVRVGAWRRPTVVNNVETLANVPFIVGMGGAAYAAIGAPDSPGPKLFSVSGCVRRPGVYELPMGIRLRELIDEHAGGLRDGRTLKGVIPGGLSTPVIPAESVDCRLDFASLSAVGSALGSGAVIVIDDSVCMVKLAHRAVRFFTHESCGKCTPCREGTAWMAKILGRLEGGDGTPGDLELLLDVAAGIQGTTFCPLGESAGAVVTAMVKHFGAEFDDHLRGGRCAP